ncbi:hypothetical protein CIK76_15090 [Glutamicibacter sp. BW80]|nr:hypothetical protein CIK76_15090 [Glutamicibacter sp. BW80]
MAQEVGAARRFPGTHRQWNGDPPTHVEALKAALGGHEQGARCRIIGVSVAFGADRFVDPAAQLRAMYAVGEDGIDGDGFDGSGFAVPQDRARSVRGCCHHNAGFAGAGADPAGVWARCCPQVHDAEQVTPRLPGLPKASADGNEPARGVAGQVLSRDGYGNSVFNRRRGIRVRGGEGIHDDERSARIVNPGAPSVAQWQDPGVFGQDHAGDPAGDLLGRGIDEANRSGPLVRHDKHFVFHGTSMTH